jgi:predicted secreted Zn-dependent protease
VNALTGLIVALTALWAAVRVVLPRLRRRHRAEPEG